MSPTVAHAEPAPIVQAEPRTTVAVLIPTYRRHDALGRCLDALAAQARRPDDVVVVVRDTDQPTRALLAAYPEGKLPLRVVVSEMPGVVTALNLGLRAITADLIAITDDDSAPWPDWLARIERHFAARPDLGGLGGRDWVYHDGVLLDGVARRVHTTQWFGRKIGNNHLAVRAPREVEFLKGVNMSFRRAALRDIEFDTRLKGQGAQPHNDSAFSNRVKRAGWTLLYDPATAVDHFPASRMLGDERVARDPIETYNTVYNETLILLEYFSPVRRLVYLAWACLVGTSVDPGFVQILRGRQRFRGARWARLRMAWRARFDAYRVAER